MLSDVIPVVVALQIHRTNAVQVSSMSMSAQFSKSIDWPKYCPMCEILSLRPNYPLISPYLSRIQYNISPSCCYICFRVWICDQQIKKLEKSYRKHYLRAFLLRRKMLLFIQNISYYMTNEVIEQHWFTFLNVIKKVSQVLLVGNEKQLTRLHELILSSTIVKP